MSPGEPGPRSGRPFAPVWALTAAVAAAAAGLTGWVLAGLGVYPGAPFEIPWWILAPAFYLSELTVVHLRFHRHAHSFSMTEVPIVVGLFLADPVHLVVGQMVGTLAAFGLHRRQAPVKAAFNTAQFALQTTTAVLVFRAIASGRDALDPVTTLGALAAVASALVVANVLVNAAIRLAGGHLTGDEMTRVFLLGGAAALMNGALGLVASTVMWLAPQAAWLALIPPVVLFLAYRAYTSQRQERSRLATLYDVTRELHRTPQIEKALSATTRRARQLFDAEIAEAVLLPEGSGGDAFITSAGPTDTVQQMERVPAYDVDPLTLRALTERVAVLSGDSDPDRRPGSGSRAMAAPLFERESVIGALVVREPSSEVGLFGSSDLTMLETLAGQVSVSLENGRLADSLVQLTRLKEELHHQTLHDNLTGLANRRLLQERLDEAVHRARTGSGWWALLFLDLDEFKEVNDSLGHAAGDDLLRMVADRLQAACRPGDTIARLGGDEFAVLLADLPRPHAAEAVAERIQDTLARPFTIGGTTVFTTASLGIAHVGRDDDRDDVLRRADQAMYAAKWQNKGSYEVFADSMSEGVRRWIQLRGDLETALDESKLELHYQPILDVRTGEILGAEALLRWDHPLLGPITPPELLSVAEDAGLIHRIAEWTIDRAATDVARLRRSSPELWVSVNLSATQLEPEAAELVATALAAHDLPAEALVIEITETAATQSSEGVLTKLAALGVRIALDDFGTGYSSLARLDTLPIDILKIDRSFVDRIAAPEGSPLIQIVVDMGQTLGLATIAEGVETTAQRDRLMALGCHHAQGFLYAPAVPIEDFEVMAPHPLRPAGPGMARPEEPAELGAAQR